MTEENDAPKGGPTPWPGGEARENDPTGPDLNPNGAPRQADAPDLEHALAELGYVEGERVELCALRKREGRSSETRSRLFLVTNDGPRFSSVAALADELGAKGAGWDYYAGMNPVTGAKGGRPVDDEVATVRGLLIDLDPGPRPTRPKKGEPVPPPFAATLEDRAASRALADRILSRLAGLGVRPALVDSGRGRQLWLRHEPVPAGDPRLSVRSRLLRALAATLERTEPDGGRAHVDAGVANLSRICRLPGTRNLRTGERAAILAPHEGEASLEDLARLADELEAEGRRATSPSDPPPDPPPPPQPSSTPSARTGDDDLARAWSALAPERLAELLGPAWRVVAGERIRLEGPCPGNGEKCGGVPDAAFCYLSPAPPHVRCEHRHSCGFVSNAFNVIAGRLGGDRRAAAERIKAAAGIGPSRRRSRGSAPETPPPPSDDGAAPEGAGAGGSGSRKSAAALLLELSTDADLFRDPAGAPYATIPGRSGGRTTVGVRSNTFKLWLGRLFFEAHGKAAGNALDDALGILEARALFEGAEREVFVRVGALEGAVFVDLGDATGQAVKITAHGWEVVAEPAVRFRRPRGALPLPEPTRGGSLDPFFACVNVPSEEGRRLVTGWAVASMKPGPPRPILALKGPQGSAKSGLTSALGRLLDPSKRALSALPETKRDLAIHARNAHVLGFDNCSYIPPEVADALCRLYTGAAFATRKLHSDDEECLFEGANPIILNGITNLLERSDLAQRAYSVELPRIDRKRRRPERVLERELAEAIPGALGFLCDAVACSLRRVGTFAVSELERTADADEWVEAAAPALGWPAGDFLRLRAAKERDGAASVLDLDPVGSAVRVFVLERREWTGTAGELGEALKRDLGDSRPPRGWPDSPRGLTAKLDRLATALREGGIVWAKGERTSRGQLHTLALAPVAHGLDEDERERFDL